MFLGFANLRDCKSEEIALLYKKEKIIMEGLDL